MAWIEFAVSALVLAGRGPEPANAGVPPPAFALDRVRAAVESGVIDESEGARQQLFFLFDRARMDPRWRIEGEPPARCGTVILEALRRRWDSLDPGARDLYRRYVAPAAASAATKTYDTAHFHIEYATAGPDAPPAADVAPADGVPDFVERTGEACEHSWAVEVDQLGYRAPALSPPGHRYPVTYQAQSSYGYTVVLSGQSTEIVLHPSYVDFPFNQDPDGNEVGALRVTVAHELKHAIQRMYTNWIEDNWLELDATWIEDLVYDEVNDYLNLIRLPGSPFTSPQAPLNAGGSGSYEDCNWEHFQSQKFGNDFLRRFWDRRAVNSEPVISTYAAIFAEEGVSFEDAWGEYVAWNLASGARAGLGFGYEEAATYPTEPTGTLATALPVPATPWTASPLAAGVHLVDNADGALSGVPEFRFSASPQIAFRVSVLLQRRSGALVWIPVALNGGAATVDLTGYDYADLRWAALLVGNPYEGGPPFGYVFSASALAPIQIAHARLLDTTSGQPTPIVARVLPGTSAVSAGSVTLTYRVEGGALTDLPMTPTENPDEYAAWLPGQALGAVTEYAIGAQSTLGEPARAPAIPNTFYSFQVVDVFEPFESDGTWTAGEAGDDATGGVWERAEPRGTAAAPYTDATPAPGAACWVTQNGAPGGGVADADVDGGKTTLLSPVYAFLSGRAYDSAIARYRRWYVNDIGSRPDDVWRVDASNDGGVTWTTVESASLGRNEWVPVTVDLLAAFGAPDRVRFRFVAADTGRASVVEAGVDDFELLARLHDPVGVGGSEASAFRLGPPVPNPSRTDVSLTFTLRRAAPIRAIVRDLQGRLVRRLAAGPVLPAGVHTLVWDGADERGALARAGLYTIEVSTGGERRVVRAIRLR